MSTASDHSGEHPGEASPRRRPSASGRTPRRLLDEVLGEFGALDTTETALGLITQVLASTLIAFTRTSSVRDPLVETAAGSPAEALAVLAGIDHLRASLAAAEATWQITAEQRLRHADVARGAEGRTQGRGASQEIALARRISPAASSFSQARARRLTRSMPHTLNQLWSGKVTEQQASAVTGALDDASPQTCSRIDEMIREDPQLLHGKGFKRLQTEIRALAQQIEPEDSEPRTLRAARRRHVAMTPLEDGMARVSAVLRAIDATAVMKSLHTRAESMRAAGEREPLRALEADLLVNDVLLATNVDAGVRARPVLDVGIVITDTALLGRDDDAEPAKLDGYGLIPAHVVKDTLRGRPPGEISHTWTVPADPEDAADPSDPLAVFRAPGGSGPGTAGAGRLGVGVEGAGAEGAGAVGVGAGGGGAGGDTAGIRGLDAGDDPEIAAFYRRLYTHPSTGELIGMESRARAFPAGLARMIRWRDVTCRSPWCNARIRHSDHVLPHHSGGETSFANGQGLCARCNYLKEHGVWTFTPFGEDAPGGGGPSRAPARNDAGRPPGAWIWTSPHGATGLSPTPSIVPPARSPRPGSRSASPEGASEAPSDRPPGAPPGPPPTWPSNGLPDDAPPSGGSPPPG